MRRKVTLGLVGLAFACASAAAGDLKGRILITRQLTKKRISIDAYALRGVALKNPAAGESDVDEYGRTVVYLAGPNLGLGQPANARVLQQDRRFDPEIVIVPAGSTVSFPNADPIFHNVFSLSKARKFDLGYYPEGRSRSVTFDKPGVVQVYCHLHPNMNAAVVVAPSGWYTRPDSQGEFLLRDIPEGPADVVTWHKSAGFFPRRVNIPATGTAEISIEIPIIESDGDR